MEISYAHKNAVVTGAGRGIGRAMAKAFIECKAEKVYAVDVDKEQLDSLASEVARLGKGTIVPIAVNLCDWDATKAALENIGPVHVLVNSAGIFIGEAFGEIKPESFDKKFTINVKAVINVSQVVVKNMIAHRIEGCIISLSSQASQMALRYHSIYSATKSALEGMMRVMAMELGPHKIRVLTVNPTVVYTDMGRAQWSDPAKAKPLLDRIPLSRFAEVEEVTNVILFLGSEKAGMINATSIPIEGGILAT